MAVSSKLLTTLTALAVGTAGVAIATSASAAPTTDSPNGFAGQITRACSIDVGTTAERVQSCCSVIRNVGLENLDFLQAVALGNPRASLFDNLDNDLVPIVLACRQEAVNRLAELALGVSTAGPTGPTGPTTLYTG